MYSLLTIMQKIEYYSEYPDWIILLTDSYISDVVREFIDIPPKFLLPNP
jgi:hypothetical protein